MTVAGILILTCAYGAANRAASETTAPKTPSCSRPGHVWWNELLATDTENLATFYAEVIGWKIKVVDPQNTNLPARNAEDRYLLFMDGSEEAAGLMKSDHVDAAHSGAGWFIYIHVLDVDAAVIKVQEKGGTVLRLPATTAEGDRIAVVSDPLGNVFGLVKPANRGC